VSEPARSRSLHGRGRSFHASPWGSSPFSLVGSAKPSLSRYRSVIAGARNRTFHDIFSIGRPFRVRLSGDAFQHPQLTLFREHGRRDPALTYADRELVELLEGFTRAAEAPVPGGFWETNLDVMDAVVAVARAVRDALLLLAREQPR
jgi:hypothetical protein